MLNTGQVPCGMWTLGGGGAVNRTDERTKIPGLMELTFW